MEYTSIIYEDYIAIVNQMGLTIKIPMINGIIFYLVDHKFNSSDDTNFRGTKAKHRSSHISDYLALPIDNF